MEHPINESSPHIETSTSTPIDRPVSLTFTHHGTLHTFSFTRDATLVDLSQEIEQQLEIPISNQKFMITPKVGILKPPFSTNTSLATLASKKITLLAPTPSELSSLSASSAVSRASPRVSPIKAAAPARTNDWKKRQEEAIYTFQTLIPLSYLPNPARSLRFLERLRDDAGIKAAMRKHKFSVAVLTEMNPADHTTHESRTLGLNRNRGEAIELRLRTDAYDGYRDYKVIRKTLCHELAHNVWGEHDRNFWDLTNQIEKEVETNDWRAGGNSVGNEEFYNPNDNGLHGGHIDGGGWTGGEFVLGSLRSTSGAAPGVLSEGLSRREAMARAAEERMKKQKEVGKRSGDDSGA